MQDFLIPGCGEQTFDYCNHVVGAEYCSDCGKLEARFYHCNNWACPECYFWTAGRAARRVEDRLLGVKKAYDDVGKKPGRFFHVTFSLPESEYETFDIINANKKIIEYCKMIGFLGGAVVFHPFRIKKHYHKPLFDAIKGSDLKGGIWRGVHEDLLKLGSWSEYVRFAPHFHVIGFFKMEMKSNDFAEKTGWIYYNVDGNRGRNDEDIYYTARYLLTHHAVIEHKQAVRYFGIASYSKTSVNAVKNSEFKKCPECYSENYYLISCYDYQLEKYVSGEEKVKDEDLFLHVMIRKTVKTYYVRLKQSELNS